MSAIPIEGVQVHSLRSNHDPRGSLTEIFRESWFDGRPHPLQWNAELSRPRVLRGVHVHLTHTDFTMVLSGSARIVLVDVRPESPSFRQTWSFDSGAPEPVVLVIPPRVAHGFYFADESIQLVATSEYWKPHERLGCRWNDPLIRDHWPDAEPLVLPVDAALPSVDELVAQLAGQPVSH